MSDELLLSPGPDDGDWSDVVKRAKKAHRRSQIQLAIALIALAVVGIASAYGLGAVPWSSRKPELAPAHPPIAPPCGAKDIRGRALLQGATQSLVGQIRLANVGRRKCSLLGWPKLSVVGESGEEEKIEIRHLQPSGPRDPTIDPRGSLRALEPKKLVRVNVQWINECRPGARLELALGDGSRIPIPSDVPPCVDHSQPPGLTFSLFEPATPARGSTMFLPLRVRIVGRRETTVLNGVPAFRVKRGTIFRFQVSLANFGSAPVRFRRCPVYEEQGPATGGDRGSLLDLVYVLNCRRARVIAPGETVLFQMQMPFPKDTLLGESRLFWWLSPHSAHSPSATAELRVVR